MVKMARKRSLRNFLRMKRMNKKSRKVDQVRINLKVISSMTKWKIRKRTCLNQMKIMIKIKRVNIGTVINIRSSKSKKMVPNL